MTRSPPIRAHLEGEAAEGDDLVEQDAVAPHVRHRREDPVRQGLGRHPSHRQHPAPREPVVVAGKNILRCKKYLLFLPTNLPLEHGSRHAEV